MQILWYCQRSSVFCCCHNLKIIVFNDSIFAYRVSIFSFVEILGLWVFFLLIKCSSYICVIWLWGPVSQTAVCRSCLALPQHSCNCSHMQDLRLLIIKLFELFLLFVFESLGPEFSHLGSYCDLKRPSYSIENDTDSNVVSDYN